MAKKILVVDDQKGIRDILSKILTKEGFIVLTAKDGNSALKLAKESIPDLILLDIMMPGMDGGMVLVKIQENETLKNVPVILLTGAVTEEEALIRNRIKANRSYMAKSTDVAEQVKVIKKVLGV
jgi:CheY-like chemotaxis protein